MTTPRELIKRLELLPQDQEIAYDLWQVADVEVRAPDFTVAQCEHVLYRMHQRKRP